MAQAETIPEARIPTTRYKDIVYYHKDLTEAAKKCLELFESKHPSRASLRKMIRREMLAVNKQYNPKLSISDYYSFNSIEGLKSFLMSCSDFFSFDKEEIIQHILHESEHYQKAKSFGCSLKEFSAWLGVNEMEKEICYLAATWINLPKKTNKKSCIEIALAPQNPSYLDRLFAS